MKATVKMSYTADNNKKKALCFLVADQIYTAYPRLVKQEKQLSEQYARYNYTKEDARYLLAQGARTDNNTRVQIGRIGDPTGNAAISAESYCQYLNKKIELDKQRMSTKLEALRWAIRKFDVIMDFLPADEADVIRQVYLERRAKSSINNRQGKRLTYYNVNQYIDSAVCYLAQYLEMVDTDEIVANAKLLRFSLEPEADNRLAG